MVNLGHAYRKCKQYRRAVHWYNRALSLAPAQAGTYAALGYTHHLQVSHANAGFGQRQQAFLPMAG